jgi:hypothetical protein
VRRHATLAAAAALILIANAFALLHAARNRSAVDATITLTDRELSYIADPDDSGVLVTLRWNDPTNFRYAPNMAPEDLEPEDYLDKAKLDELGFNTGVDPAHPEAYHFYNRQGARSAFVALEYQGEVWRRWIEKNERIAETMRASGNRDIWPQFDRQSASRLILIDAAPDPATLRKRYPDRSRVVILPGVVRITLMTIAAPGKPGYLKGFVQEIPSDVHIPRPFSDMFRIRKDALWAKAAGTALYRVRLKFGANLEPWVDGVEFTD